ncbi:GNAT family N-acetyltransferase [Altererythrobacter sp. GH1-8]|uniref:GNAT family N-acetyltransferase n=1 Tax=Altererythrobacter sp. GH1-8 TaxID=3349333 RepID=UPI00374DED31
MTSRLATPTLETERFILRPLVREDAEAFYPTLSDPEQCAFLLQPAFSSIDQLADWLCDREWDGRSWTAVDRENDECVARLVAVPAGDQQSGIGYITAAHRQGEGIAKECAGELMRYLFEAEQHHRLTAGTDPQNSASNRVLEKLGFRREAHFVKSVKTHMGWCDEYIWALLRSDWQARQ